MSEADVIGPAESWGQSPGSLVASGMQTRCVVWLHSVRRFRGLLLKVLLGGRTTRTIYRYLLSLYGLP